MSGCDIVSYITAWQLCRARPGLTEGTLAFLVIGLTERVW